MKKEIKFLNLEGYVKVQEKSKIVKERNVSSHEVERKQITFYNVVAYADGKRIDSAMGITDVAELQDICDRFEDAVSTRLKNISIHPKKRSIWDYFKDKGYK